MLSGSTGSTAFDSEFDDSFDDEPEKRAVAWHGGLDFGLLVLRLVLGGLFIAHGLDKLFGWFDGLGRGGTEQLLTGFGFHDVKILTWVLAVSETAGGLLLVLGLLTPVGAAAILARDGQRHRREGRLERVPRRCRARDDVRGRGVRAAVHRTRPGFALDRNTHWFRKAPAYGFVFLIVAAGAAVVTLFVFR